MSAQNKLGLYEFESERTDCNSLSPSANERAAFQRFDILYDSEHTCSKQTLKQFSPLCLVRCCGFVGVSSRCPAWCCTDVVRFSLKQETRVHSALISPSSDFKQYPSEQR